MFWDSVLGGLKVLTYWEVYVAGLAYLAIFFIPMAIISMVMEKDEGRGAFTGCLSKFLIPLPKAVAMAIMILTIAPIIFGLSEDAAWSFPWQFIVMEPGVFLMLLSVLAVVHTAIPGFVPINPVQSLQTLVLGGITLVIVLNGILDSISPGIVKDRVDFIPGFWFSTSLIVLGYVLSGVGMIVGTIIGSVFAMGKKNIGELIVIPISEIFGFVPVFMYGAWIGAQVRGGF